MDDATGLCHGFSAGKKSVEKKISTEKNIGGDAKGLVRLR